jgi:phage baseplate assembly protein W
MRLALTMDEARVRLAEVTARLAKGGYPAADAYYADKDRARRLSAHLQGKSPREIDPAGYWYGMQSN